MTKDLASRMREYGELDGKRNGGPEWVVWPPYINEPGGVDMFAVCQNMGAGTSQVCETEYPDNANFIAASPAIYADAALMYGLLRECIEALENYADMSQWHAPKDGSRWKVEYNNRGADGDGYYTAQETIEKLKTHGLIGEGE